MCAGTPLALRGDVQHELLFELLIVFLGIMLVPVGLIAMCTDNQLNWSLSSIIRFSLAIVVFCIIIAVFTASVYKGGP